MLPFNGLLFTRPGPTHGLLTVNFNSVNMGLERWLTELIALVALLKDLDFVFSIHMETPNCLYLML